MQLNVEKSGEQDKVWLVNTDLDFKEPLTTSITLSKTTNFRLFQTQAFADNNFKFDDNGRKSNAWLENTVGKGEIARYE